MRNSKLTTEGGVFILQSTKRWHWVFHENEDYFGSHNFQPPKILYDFIIRLKRENDSF